MKDDECGRSKYKEENMCEYDEIFCFEEDGGERVWVVLFVFRKIYRSPLRAHMPAPVPLSSTVDGSTPDRAARGAVLPRCSGLRRCPATS
jgi:hypothetical protein